MTADLQRRALASDLARRLQLTSHDELRVLDRVLGRLELGRQRYGLLDLGKPRDWQRERFEERLDALVYDVCDELVLEDAARAGLREDARREMLGEDLAIAVEPAPAIALSRRTPEARREYILNAAQAGAITREVAEGMLAAADAFDAEHTRMSSVPAQLAGADPRDSYDELAIEETGGEGG